MGSRSITKPSYVEELEQAYGVPSQAAFGSAVFYEPDIGESHLDEFALSRHKYFCGETWTRFGEENWLENWKQVFGRKSGSKGDIVAELGSLEDRDARSSASMLLDNAESHDALIAAFDDPGVSSLRIFRIGDGNAMSGLLIASLRRDGAVALVFLMD